MCIKNAWQHISTEVIVQGFNKCCIFSIVNGTDDKLWNGSKEDGNVRSECKADEDTDCEDGGSDTDW